MRQVERDDKVHDWLARHRIKWQFNLSQAPWWGGKTERLDALVKQCLHKTIGNINLQCKKLQDVILDVKITLNNHPPSYMEEDIQLPVLYCLANQISSLK